MNADQSNLSRLLQNLIRLGTIAEVEGAKARVQLGPKLTTEWLNWITQRAGSTCTWSAPTVGEQVVVLSPGGDLARGVSVPALFSKAFDALETSDAIHTTHYPDGAVVQYDHAAHSLTATLPGGTATIRDDPYPPVDHGYPDNACRLAPDAPPLWVGTAGTDGPAPEQRYGAAYLCRHCICHPAVGNARQPDRPAV